MFKACWFEPFLTNPVPLLNDAMRQDVSFVRRTRPPLFSPAHVWSYWHQCDKSVQYMQREFVVSFGSDNALTKPVTVPNISTDRMIRSGATMGRVAKSPLRPNGHSTSWQLAAFRSACGCFTGWRAPAFLHLPARYRVQVRSLKPRSSATNCRRTPPKQITTFVS